MAWTSAAENTTLAAEAAERRRARLLRLRRALHVFQLEGYKRKRFLDWARSYDDPEFEGRSLVGHEKWGEAWWLKGATERHVMRVKSEAERRLIEEDLIRGLHPRMNDIHLPRDAMGPGDSRWRRA